MTAASCRCGATWTGYQPQHCLGCHRTYSGTTAGDKHRTGDHALSTGPDRRRCLTLEELLVKGFTQNERGYWSWGGQKPSFWQTQTELESLPESQWGPVPPRQKEALESEFSEESA